MRETGHQDPLGYVQITVSKMGSVVEILVSLVFIKSLRLLRS